MIEISATRLDAINAHAERAFPRESCGFLLGRKTANGSVHVLRTMESANVTAGDGREHFEIDPQVHFDLMRELANADTQMEIVGHYHSHPCHRAEPSKRDIDMAFEPDFIWLITAVGADARARETRAWRLAREPRSVAELRVQML